MYIANWKVKEIENINTIDWLGETGEYGIITCSVKTSASTEH